MYSYLTQILPEDFHLIDHNEPFNEIWLKVKKRAFSTTAKSSSLSYAFHIAEYPVKLLM